MTKYNWKQLEREYILSDYKTVAGFIKSKGIPNNGSTKKRVSGWKSKKVLKDEKKSAKIIEKVIEKESEKSANQIVQITDVANKLLEKVAIATDELNKSTDVFGKLHTSQIVDRVELKKLTSALKDLNDILGNKTPDNVTRVQIINDLPSDDDET